MSNVAPEKLRYLSQSIPLEKPITFDDLQNRPTGFQTAIPRDPIAEQMNSMEFKNMEGMMYEAAAASSKQLRQEHMREAMVDEAAAIHGIPHQYIVSIINSSLELLILNRLIYCFAWINKIIT